MSAAGAAAAAGGREAVLWFCMRAHILLNPRPHGRGGRRVRCGCCALSAAALVSVCLGAARTETWRDIETRIQYGYYTEDAPALRSLADPVAADESHDKLHGYYAGLLAWPLALRAACLAPPRDANGSQTSHAAHRARRDIERALQLAGRNPRVLLLDAMNDYQLAPRLGGNKERALVKLRQAVAAFEVERTDTEHLPGWGAAEAYLLLARDLLDHGEPVGARDALEHALLLAPEFAQARRLMAQIISG